MKLRIRHIITLFLLSLAFLSRTSAQDYDDAVKKSTENPLNQQLVEAARQNDMQRVRELIYKGAYPPSKNVFDGNNALHWAVFYGDLDTAQFLVNRGVWVNDWNENGWTPLHIAAQKGYDNLVNWLLRWGADPRIQDGWYGATPLFLAAMEGNAACVDLLARGITNVNTVSGYFGYTPLHIAAERGHYEIVKMLIERRAWVNFTNERRQTALHLAAARGYSKVCELLADSWADMNPRDYRGVTPLHEAVYHGNTDAAILLVSKGAKPGLATKKQFFDIPPGKTALDIARIKKNPSLTEFLKGLN